MVELCHDSVKHTFYGQLLLGKAEFKQGNFSAATMALKKAEEMVVCIPEDHGEKEECERQLTVWLHKSQIELSTEKKSAGNINVAAFLPSTRVEAQVQKQQTRETPVEVAPQKVATGGDGSAALDLKYDWY